MKTTRKVVTADGRCFDVKIRNGVVVTIAHMHADIFARERPADYAAVLAALA